MTMMIRPVLPHLYKFDVNNIGVIISAALMLISTVLVALLIARYQYGQEPLLQPVCLSARG